MSQAPPINNGLPPRRIKAVAEELHLNTENILPHGHFIAKRTNFPLKCAESVRTNYALKLPVKIITDSALTSLFTYHMFRPMQQGIEKSIFASREFIMLILPYDKLDPKKYEGRLRVVPMTPDGEIREEAFAAALTDRTRLVSVVHVSNALGTVNPVRALIRLAHARNIPVLVDGARKIIGDLGLEYFPRVEKSLLVAS
jgi:selenocysteine lyase/cysteine desulfurase